MSETQNLECVIQEVMKPVMLIQIAHDNGWWLSEGKGTLVGCSNWRITTRQHDGDNTMDDNDSVQTQIL